MRFCRSSKLRPFDHTRRDHTRRSIDKTWLCETETDTEAAVNDTVTMERLEPTMSRGQYDRNVSTHCYIQTLFTSWRVCRTKLACSWFLITKTERVISDSSDFSCCTAINPFCLYILYLGGSEATVFFVARPTVNTRRWHWQANRRSVVGEVWVARVDSCSVARVGSL